MNLKAFVSAAVLLSPNICIADEIADCWIDLHRSLVGDSNESGSFLNVLDDGSVESSSYTNQNVSVSESEDGVFVTEWDIPEVDDSGTNKLDIKSRTYQTTVYDEDVMPVDLISCAELASGYVGAVMRFTGTIGDHKYDVEDRYLAKDGELHYVRGLRPHGSDQPYAPVGVSFSSTIE